MNVDITRIQYIGFVSSVCFLFVIFQLMRKRYLKEQYALLWLFFGVVFAMLAMSRRILEICSFAIGIAYPPVALLLLFTIALFFILIQFSIVVSKLNEKNQKLVQELGLMELKIRKLSNMIKVEKK